MNKSRIAIISMGIIGIILILISPIIGLSQSGIGTGKLAVGGLCVLLIILGILWDNFSKLYSGIAVVILNTIVFLIFVELLFAGLNWLDRRNGFDPVIDLQDTNTLLQIPNRRENHPYYQTVDWGRDFWDEVNRVFARRKTYHPYIMWREQPTNGEYVNIDADGLRSVPNSNCQSDDAYRVFIFGGSTMWGEGSPNNLTIAAQLQNLMNTNLNRDVCIVNFAQGGWVAMQGLIELIRQIQADQIPDLVIFYDGVNEVISAQLSGLPDSHYGTNVIASQLLDFTPFDAQRSSDDVSLNHLLLSQLSKTHVWSYLTNHGIVSELAFEDQLLVENNLPEYIIQPNPDIPTLVSGLIEHYMVTMNIVEQLGVKYDFEVAFFWQPVVYVGDKPFTESEIAFATGDTIDLMYDMAYEQIQETFASDRFFYIADAFDSFEEQIYIDRVHVTPIGDEIIATVIWETLEANNLIQ